MTTRMISVVTSVLVIGALVFPMASRADCEALRKVASIVMKQRQNTDDIYATIKYVQSGLGCHKGDETCNAAEELAEQAFTIQRYVKTVDRKRATQAFSKTYYDGCMAGH